MKFVIVVFLCSLVFLTGCSNTNSNNSNNHNSNNVSNNSTTNNSNNAVNNSANNITNTNTDNTVNSAENIDSNTEGSASSSQPQEEVLASFSTVVSQKDPDRQTNITLACGALNGTIIKAGETFSFCDTLGPATPEAGYKEADTYDADGNTIQEYGGGKCQISSTLYNAVLAVPSFTVVERHEHSGPAYYVEEGKDACVSYGSVDFKFTNNNDFDVKIYSSNTPDSVDISIVKISS